MSPMVRMFHKVAAIAMLLLVLAPLFVVAALGWQAYRANSEEIAAKQDLFDRVRAIAGYKTQSSSTTAPDGFAGLLLGDGPPAVLSAGLQARLRDMANGLNVDIQQTSELKPKPAAGLDQLGVHIEMTGPLAGVHALLLQIDQSEPWLFAEHLQIRSGFGESGQLEFEPPVSVTLDVWGLAARPPQAAQP